MQEKWGTRAVQPIPTLWKAGIGFFSFYSRVDQVDSSILQFYVHRQVWSGLVSILQILAHTTEQGRGGPRGSTYMCVCSTPRVTNEAEVAVQLVLLHRDEKRSYHQWRTLDRRSVCFTLLS